MLGELNSTIIFLRPADGSEGSLRPKLGLKPNDLPDLRIVGIVSATRGAPLKKKLIQLPLIFGFSTSGDSGNCTLRSASLYAIEAVWSV